MSDKDRQDAQIIGQIVQELPADAREHLLAYGEGMAALAALRASKDAQQTDKEGQ